MLTNSLKEILLPKWKKGEMGHFYILRGDNLSQNIEDFCSAVLQLTKQKTSQLGHPDIISIKPDKKGYRLGDQSLEYFLQVDSFGPMELARKIIIVYEADTIAENYGNKMLKTLEEAKEYCTIFFLVEGAGVLLPTIESRAIKLSLRKSDEQKRESRNLMSKKLETRLREYINTGNSGQLLEILKGNHKEQNALYNFLLDFAANSTIPANIVDELKRFELAKEFHGNTSARFFNLLEALLPSVAKKQKLISFMELNRS